MKATKRLVIGASVVLILLLVLLARHLLDLGNQYSAWAYFRTSLANSLFNAPSNYPPTIHVEVDDKVVVMAKMESEDTDWVARELPSFVTTTPLFFSSKYHPQAPSSNIHLTHYPAGNAQSTPSIPPTIPPQTPHSPPL